MNTTSPSAIVEASRYPRPDAARASKILARNLRAYKHYWMAFFSGFFEPVFYLVAVGYGVGQFVPDIVYRGVTLDYTAFLAPGLLAASTMNGALFDGFFGPFFKLNWMKTYESIITTPMNIADIAVGEIFWALFRSTIYGVGFLSLLLVMGLIRSPWALLALPAVMLSGGALASGAMIFTFLSREVSVIEKVMTLVYFPLFLFSGTFFPVEQYPDVLQPVVWTTPLFHSASLLRQLTTGAVDGVTIVHAAYLVVLGLVCTRVVATKMRSRLIV